MKRHRSPGAWLALAVMAVLLAVLALPLSAHNVAAAGIPDQPTNISPAGGTTDIGLTHLFRSSPFSHADPEAIHYASQWQVTTVAGNYSLSVFDSGVDKNKLVELEMSAGVLSVNTTYYWRVRYQDNFGNWSSWSSETSFRTIVSGNPSRPINISPANGTTDILLTPTLQSSRFVSPDGGSEHTSSQWQMSTRSGTYSNPTFDSGIDVTHLVNINIPPGFLVPGAIYYWHVRYQDSYGRWSDYSEETSFTTVPAPPPVASEEAPLPPVAVSPMNAATDVSLIPTLESSAFSSPPPPTGDTTVFIPGVSASPSQPSQETATHAASQWQITTKSGDYSNPVFDSGRDKANLVSIDYPDVLTVKTTYYWRVRHQDTRGNWSNWSFEVSFTTVASEDPIRPIRPVNRSPGTRTVDILLTPTLQSSGFVSSAPKVSHAASQWQITTRSGDYSSLVFDSSVDSANLTKVVVPKGVLAFSTTYYWHVRYQDSYGAWSEFSRETSFTTIASRLPRQPTLVLPSGAAANVGLTPILQSSTFAGAETDATHAASRWQISTRSGDYSSPVFDGGIDTVNLIKMSLPAGVLLPGTTYYWRVQHRDSFGNWSDYSRETSFTTVAARPPKQPSVISPTDAATGVGLTPILQSSTFSGSEVKATHAASQWQITVKAGDYSAPIYDSGRNTANLTKISLSAGILTLGNTYYWHVRHQDNYGTWSEYSREVSFATITSGVEAGFSAIPTNAVTSQIITFTDQSSGDIVAWTWGFGDGSTVKWTAQNRPANGQVVRAYSRAGTYKVSLTVSGPQGDKTTEKPGYITVSAPAASTPEASAGGGLPWIWIIVVGVLIVGVVALVLVRRR